MFGIIAPNKEEFLRKKELLNNNIKGEFFNNGFFALFQGDDGFCVKDNSNKKILIFEGKLFVDNYEINAELNRQDISNTIFSLYLKKGLDFLCDLKGEFILGLWDEDLNRFCLARDKLGIRHIHYSLKNGSFIFSSKMNFFHDYNFIEKKLNLNALDLYCSFKFIPSPHTIFKDISKLSPASFVVWDKGNLYTRKYWEIVIKRLENKNKLEDDVNEVERLIKRAILRRVSGDKKICSHLSGGIDTSTIAGLATNLRINSFSVFFAKDENNYQDSKTARSIARHFKIKDYYETEISWLDMMGHLPGIIKILEEPMVDPSSVYLHAINGMARNYGDTILGGDGGDVLFGPHRFYYLLNLANKLSCFLPSRTLDFFANVSFKPSLKYRFLALRDSKSREASFLDILSVFPKTEKDKIFTNRLKKELCRDLDTELLRTYFNKSDTFIDLLIKFDLENILPDMFLLRGNKLARYSSMDYCAPFMDEDLVEYVCKMSESNLFNMLNRKIILKMILNRLGIPSKILYKKRKPLLAPTGKWLKKGMNRWLKELLSYETISSQGFFVHSEVDKIFGLAHSDLRAQIQLWAVSFFTLWFDIFISNNSKYKSFKAPM